MLLFKSYSNQRFLTNTFGFLQPAVRISQPRFSLQPVFLFTSLPLLPFCKSEGLWKKNKQTSVSSSCRQLCASLPTTVLRPGTKVSLAFNGYYFLCFGLIGGSFKSSKIRWCEVQARVSHWEEQFCSQKAWNSISGDHLGGHPMFSL